MKFSILLTIPVILLLIFLQTVVAPTIKFANGHADLVLVFVAAWALQEKGQPVWLWTLVLGFTINAISGLPMYIYLITYLLVAGIARLIKLRTWQMPVLAMLFTTLIGSLFELLGSYVLLRLDDYNLPFRLSLNTVILPSIVLNLMLCIPVYLLVTDFHRFLQPEYE